MQSKKETIAVAVFGLLFWAALAVVSHQIWVAQQEKLFDFYPRWHGAREMLDGQNPYTLAINQDILTAMGYQVWEPYRHNFLYPATVTYILLPFWLAPWELSISVWLGLNLLLMLSLPLIIYLVVLRWRIPPLLLVLVIFFSAFVFRHAMNTYLVGQFLFVILGCLVLAWWQTVAGRPWLVALALLGATLRPDGAIIVAAFLFDLLLTRRYKTVGLWLGMMGGLFLLSWVQVGFWVPDMLASVRGYRECCIYAYPPDVLGIAGIAPFFSVGVLVWGGVMLWQMRPLPDLTRIPWSLAVVGIVYLLVFTQSKDYTLVYGLLAAWVVIWAAKGRGWTVGAVLLLLATPWLYAARGATLAAGYPLEQLLTPVLLGLLLSYQWWRWKTEQPA